MLYELAGFSTIDLSTLNYRVKTATTHSRSLTLLNQLLHVCVLLCLTKTLTRIYVPHRIIMPHITIVEIRDLLLNGWQIHIVTEFFKHVKLTVV